MWTLWMHPGRELDEPLKTDDLQLGPVTQRVELGEVDPECVANREVANPEFAKK